ncbi:MAG: Ig-like domain-containing protein [Bacteroidales bacterium]|nr:Ig-like domain-containing protein [Bacteroidales bacterium]
MASAVLALFLAGCGEDEDAKVALKSIKISPETEVSLVVEGTQKFTATLEPANATDVKIKWNVPDDQQVISVADDGLVTAKSVGEATVWASSGDVQSKKVTVKVTLKALTSFTVTPNSLTNLKMGDAPVQLTITKTPADAGGSFTYTPGNADVVTVSTDGLVTIVGTGSTDITVTSGSLAAVVVPVTVTVQHPLTSFTVDATSFPLEQDHSRTIVVTPTPANAENAQFSFASSNENVATVGEDGKVLGLAIGAANITVSVATPGSGVAAQTVAVTVTRKLHFPLALGVGSAGSTAEGGIHNATSTLNDDGSYTIVTTGASDPYVTTGNLGARPLGANVTKVELQFEYKAADAINFYQVLFPDGAGSGNPFTTDFSFAAATEWTAKTVDITNIANYGRGTGNQYNCVRLDGPDAASTVSIRNLQVVIEAN